MLKIEKDNLLSNRTFRNPFEHYDERIEQWYTNQSSIFYIDLAMNPSLLEPASNVNRGYNSFNNTLVFRDKILDLNEILKALEEILNKCRPYSPI